MSRNGVQARAAGELALDVRDERLRRGGRRGKRRALRKKDAVNVQQPPGLLVGCSAHHYAVDAIEMRGCLIEIGDAAIEYDSEPGMRGLESIDAVVIEWRDVAVGTRRKPGEPGLAGVHYKREDTGLLDRAGERLQRLLRVLVINADTAFDRDRHLHPGS